MSDILDKIDAVTGELCACGCNHPLDPVGASGWFADQTCQQRWNQQHAANPNDVYRRHDPAFVFSTAARWIPPETVEEAEARLTAQREAVRATFEQVAAGVARFFEDLGNALRPLVSELASAAKHLQAAGVIDEAPPADSMARALWLRQRRNTGPKVQQRAPRRIDARRSR